MKHQMRAFMMIFVLAFSFFAANSYADFKSDYEVLALQYFIDNAHPTTGMVRDRAENFMDTPEWNRVASIASTGFGLSVIANAGVRGLIPRDQAEAYVLKTLTFARDHVPRRKGWFVHYFDWETGVRLWASEYSTIDTALFMTGALYAAQVFADNAAIVSITHGLYSDMDFYDAMTDGGTRPDKRALSMAYTEEHGYTPGQWDMYAEQRVLLLMGLGHPTHPLPPEAWLAWDRTTTTLPDQQVVMGYDAALFIHQYSELYVDFRGFHDGYRNYFDNGRIMTDFHRKIGQTDKNFQTLREGFWGFSAGDSASGYRVWNPAFYRSTVCVGCVVGSAMFLPDVVMGDVEKWANGPYRAKIWGRYGLTDSIDIDQNWYSTQVLGITVGPAYLAMVNTDDSTSIWKDFMQIPEIKVGMDRASTAGQGAVSDGNPVLPQAR